MMPPIRNTNRQAIGCKEKSRRFYIRVHQLAEIYIFEKLSLFGTIHLYSKQPAVCWFYLNLSVYLCMRMNIRSNIRSICELIRSVDDGACLCLLAHSYSMLYFLKWWKRRVFAISSICSHHFVDNVTVFFRMFFFFVVFSNFCFLFHIWCSE